MKITIQENAQWEETEVLIRCKQVDQEILRILAALRELDQTGVKLLGRKEGKSHLLEPSDILYMDTVDRRTFLYTVGDVYESGLRLFELEERLSVRQFFRASKSAIINIAKIKTIMPDFGGRLEVTLQNGEKLTVSRQFAAHLKSILKM